MRRASLALRSIRVRLTLWYAGLLTVVLIGFGGYLYATMAHSLFAEIDQSLDAQVQRVTPPPDSRPEPPTRPPALLRPPAGRIVMVFYDASGQQALFGEILPDAPSLAEARALAAEKGRDLRTVAMDDGIPWRILTAAIDQPGRRFGMVQVARSEADARSALYQLLVQMIIAIPLIVLLAIVLGLFVAGRALNPIDRITRTAEQIGEGDLSRRLSLPSSNDEVGRLAATFDHMLDRIDGAFQRQRRFTADASHELRTPLAMMISQAEVTLERPRSRDEYRQLLSSIRDDARRMDQLLGDLLTLARADEGKIPLLRESLDLGDLVTDVVAAMAPLAMIRGVGLGPGVVQPIPIEVDQTRITQLLVNLIDNGLKYTPSGGRVTVSAHIDGDRAVLRVSDTGWGIAPEHLPHLFERFYRVDEARSRAHGGVGLGLSISRWITRAHGGDISVDSRDGDGTTFTVRLPLGPEPPAATVEVAGLSIEDLGKPVESVLATPRR